MLAVLLGCAAAEAAAQVPLDSAAPSHPPVGERTPLVPERDNPVYPATFYAAFQPQTALDMLQRTPGFTVDSGDYVRGFGGAAGNVLIDGQRPTVKAGGVSDVLRRIPARRVERIVLLRGGGETAQAAGQSLIANVILKADSTGSGTVSGTITRMPDGRLSPAGSISYNRQIGGWQTSVELSGEYGRQPLAGRYLIHDAAGALIQTHIESLPQKMPEAALAASASRSVAGGELTLNTRIGMDGYSSIQSLSSYAGTADGHLLGTSRLDYDETFKEMEFGADWTRPLGRDWSTKLVGLVRKERFDMDQDETAGDIRRRSTLRQKPFEAIARATLVRGGTHRLRPEIGGEIAYNRLASMLDYAEDTGAGMTPIPLPGSDTKVEEWRGELFANLTAAIARALTLEAGLAFELSRISVSGDHSNRQDLRYLKPSMAILWNVGAQTQVRLAIRRTVDQLDFGDFAASVNVIDNRPVGGNATLRPARITRGSLRIDHRWGTGGAIAAELFHEWRKGVLDYVQLPDGGQALGAIGNGRIWGLSAQATLPLDALVPGGQIKFDGLFRRSRIFDPVIERSRPLGGLARSSWNAEFRQDLDHLNLSWGVRYVSAVVEPQFYIDERLSARDGESWTAYLESVAIPGMKVTLTASLNGVRTHRLRDFYTGSRAGPFAGSEERLQRRGGSIAMSFSKTL